MFKSGTELQGRGCVFFVKDIDKMAILPLHNSKILREKTFGRKFSNFEGFCQMIVIQLVGMDLAKKGHRWLEKVNAKKKFGVAVLFFGVLTKPRKGTK